MKKLLFLGDSITDAEHCFSKNMLGYGFVNQLYEKLQERETENYQMINHGHDGFTIHGIKRMLERDCIWENPDIVSLLVGCNDVGVMMNTGKNLKEQQFEETYDIVVKDIKNRTNAKIICLGPFIFPYPKEYRNWIPWIEKAEEIEKRISQKYQVKFIPLQKMMLEEAETYGYEKITTDGIHLTKQGNEIITGLWTEQFAILKSQE